MIWNAYRVGIWDSGESYRVETITIRMCSMKTTVRTRLLVAIALAIAALATTNALAAAALVHHYTFEDQNCNDSVGSLNGTAVNSPTYTTDAKRGSYAVALDRSQQQYFTFIATDFGTEFSFAAWVKVAEPENIVTMIANRDGGGDIDGFIWYVNNQWEAGTEGRIRFETADGSARRTVLTPEPMSSNEWHHVAVVANTVTEGYAQLYIDGERVLTNGAITDFQTDSAWCLGAMLNPDHYFDGFMDDVRIYSGELTDSEVFDLYIIPEPSVALSLGAAAAIAVLRRKK